MKQALLTLMGWMLLSQGCNYRVADDCLPPEEPVPTRMAITEEKLPAQAPIITIDVSNLSSVGIYAVREGGTAGRYPWTPTPFALNLAPSGISGNQISFNPKLYYPLGGKRIISHGCYPHTTTTATTGNNYITAPDSDIVLTYHFTLTGTEDMVYVVSTPTGGTSTSPVNLTFNHVLTQLRSNTSPLGSLSGVKLIGISNEGALNIGSGTATYDSSVANIALTIPLLGSATDTVMVPAGVASYRVEVVLSLSLLRRTYLVRLTFGAFQPRVIYTISL